jgi:hypothetical protein
MGEDTENGETSTQVLKEDTRLAELTINLIKVILIFTHMNPKKLNPESDLRPERNAHSPLDVPAVATTITKDEILSTIREIRERG